MDKRRELAKLIEQASRTPPADLVLHLNKKASPITDLGFAAGQIKDLTTGMRAGGLFTVSGPTEHGMSTTLMSLFVQDYIRKRRAAGLSDIGDVLDEPPVGVDVVEMPARIVGDVA
jgi:hypothetical protein